MTFFVGQFAVPRGNLFDGQFIHHVEYRDPAFRVAVSRVVVRAVDTRISSKQDAVVRQPSHRIADRVSVAKIQQLNSLLAVVKNQSLWELDVQQFVDLLKLCLDFRLLDFDCSAQGLLIPTSSA